MKSVSTSSTVRSEIQRDLILDLHEVLFGFPVARFLPSLVTGFLYYWWRVGKLASRSPDRWPSMYHRLVGAQEVQAHIPHIDGQQCEDLRPRQQFLAAANPAVEAM